MTVRPQVILERLAHLGFVLQQLERIREIRAACAAVDPLHELAAERGIHVAAEAIFDMGHHVLAGRGLPVPPLYREVVPALVAAGVFPHDLGVELEGLAGMRKILVHDYVSVDASKVWEAIEFRLPQLWRAHGALAGLPELTAAPPA